jgi:hypothetical protein
VKSYQLPVCPYRVSNDEKTGKLTVEFRVSSRMAAMLVEDANGFSVIPSANIGFPECLRSRKMAWRTGKIYGKQVGTQPPLTGHQRLELASGEGCDTTIKVSTSPQEWQLVGTLCNQLGITPGQWFVARAHYNAAFEESIIEKALAAVAPAND